MKILIVEDEKPIREEMVRFLADRRYVVEEAECFAAADEKIALYDYDCMVVDIMLPDGSGLDLIRKVRAAGKGMAVLVVSARGNTEDKIAGLNLGADDYMAKPFSLAELNARINAVLRGRNFDGANVVHFHELEVNVGQRQVAVDGGEVLLTRKEFDMLLYFLTNREQVLSKESIVEHLWGDTMGLSSDSFDFVYTHIRNLRSKLMNAGARDYIHTVYGVGYKFTEG